MKKTFIAAVLSGLIVFAWQGVAFAWTTRVAGGVTCQTDGQALITWTLTNSETNNPETATLSGALLGSKTILNVPLVLTQTVPGTQTGPLTLTVSATWANQTTPVVASATVTLPGNCPQPHTVTHATVCRFVNGSWQTLNLTIPPDQIVTTDHTGTCPNPIVVCRNGSTISVMPWDVITGDRQGACTNVFSLLVCRNGVTRLLIIPPDALLTSDGIGTCSTSTVTVLPSTVTVAPSPPPVQVEAATAVRANASFTG
jgi:hypothetical protein